MEYKTYSLTLKLPGADQAPKFIKIFTLCQPYLANIRTKLKLL